MNPAPPLVVVTIPARSVDEARPQVAEAAAAGADLVEIRFDRFREEGVARAGELFPSPVPLVATLRSTREGGEGPDDPAERLRTLSSILRHPFRWVDVELSHDLPAALALPRPPECALIVSSHSTSPVSPAVWGQLLRAPVPPGALRKVVVASSVGKALRDLIPDLPPPDECALVALTTGPSGPLLRVWSRRLGFPIVYAAPPERSPRTASTAVEPSQIPVDRLKPYLLDDGKPPLFGLAGHPVAHSFSPALHARWMRERKEVGLYVALDFENEKEFVEAIPSLVDGGFRGLNVTHPFKQVALELATRVGPGASACGAANTLSLEENEVSAENTDLVAVLRRLEELRSNGDWDGESLGVVGAGGAARATLAAARTLHVRSYVWARRFEAAQSLAPGLGAEPVRDPETCRPSLVVHATTVGRDPRGGVLPSAMGSWCRAGVHVLDWVYAPEDPVVRRAAERAGSTYEDGLRLLTYQASASYGLWWGDEPTEDQVVAALEGLS